jgi:hypothetical protein
LQLKTIVFPQSAVRLTIIWLKKSSAPPAFCFSNKTKANYANGINIVTNEITKE